MKSLDGTAGVEVVDRGHGHCSVWCHGCDKPVRPEIEPMTKRKARLVASRHRGWHLRLDAKRRTEERR